MKQFKLTNDQLEKIKEASRPVPYMVMGGVPPRSPQENANAAWKEVAEEIGVKWDTIRPIQGKTEEWIQAEPLIDKKL